MNVLFENILENYSSLMATNVSLNHPVENIVHPFLRQRFQSSGVSSVITFEFSEDKQADCFFYGFYNATNINVIYKDSGGGVLKTLNISLSESNLQVSQEYFNKIEGIRSLEITITGPDGVFVGGVGSGLLYSMPNIISTYNRSNIDGSIVLESTGGQNLQNYNKPKRSYSFNFGGLKKSIADSIENEYRNTGKGRALFMDITNTGDPSIYAKITNALGFSVGKVRESFNMNIQECR